MKALGEHIRELRERKALSLRQFAKELGGLSAAFISDVELGRRYPSDRVLTEMARILCVPVGDLRRHDPRAPVGDLKRLVEQEPEFGAAFRTIVNKNVSPQELLKLAEGKPRREPKLRGSLRRGSSSSPD
jgi:transcriptional regulator with XRE-family HTH domain